MTNDTFIELEFGPGNFMLLLPLVICCLKQLFIMFQLLPPLLALLLAMIVLARVTGTLLILTMPPPCHSA